MDSEYADEDAPQQPAPHDRWLASIHQKLVERGLHTRQARYELRDAGAAEPRGGTWADVEAWLTEAASAGLWRYGFAILDDAPDAVTVSFFRSREAARQEPDVPAS
jgi:hypothetical protein